MVTITNTQFWFLSGLAVVPFLYWYFVPSKRKSTKTNFDSFLKQDQSSPQTQIRDPANFSTFLKASNNFESVNVDETAKSENDTGDNSSNSNGNLIRIPIFFGTEYGFSEEIARELEQKLSSEEEFNEVYQPVVYDMADYSNGFNFKGEQVLLVICSTSGDGVPPAYARPFCEWLKDGAGGGSGLEDVYFSVLALGDRAYAHYCQCGKDIDNYLEKIGSQRFVDRVDVDCEDWDAIRTWMSNVMAGLNELPLVRQEIDVALNSSTENSTKLSKKNPYFAIVKDVVPLCNIKDQNYDKNTVKIEFDLGDSGLTYVAGDALGIYPLNDPVRVQKLISALGLTGKESVKTPKWVFNKVDLFESGGTITLYEALCRCFDIRQPKPEILEPLFSKNPQLRQKDQQKQFLEERHLVDIVREMDHIDLNLFLNSYLRPLQPRLYSISSSPLEDTLSVQLTVAEVKYTSLGVDRIGVASTYISERVVKSATKIPVYISSNFDFRLPCDISVPIIMVGPGTGLAPFRAFIIQRIKESQISNTQYGTMVLYFGCRRRDQDYLYGDQLEQWAQEGIITLYTAFSRENSGKKVYVQHRLKESGSQVWDLLNDQKGHFYVCGDAARMAGDVEAVLLEIVQEFGNRGKEQALEYLDALAASGRYQKDVWY
eukprot:TRINITY_DN5202_c0_g1_i11.p1 TRINITY_DN5202_c0_g1~~TRINITY_DN5202_c0_g1_i11.p1  ORF type:complete len:680 (-),score=89.85 TRINITY_DN5202_c0_g1_i11:366-2333(-)